MRLKDIQGKKVTNSLICVFMLAKERLYNENVGLTKLVKVLSALYEQKLVYQNPVKKQNYLNDSGPTKVVNVLTYMQTKHTVVGPVN